MSVSALAYLGVGSDKTDDWSEFACRLLGMQQVDRGGKSLAFRMDHRKQRLVVSGESGDSIAFMGWEVDSRSDLESYAARLEIAGIEVGCGSSSLADRRCVESLVHFQDPEGNRVELCWNPLADSEPFRPARPISGFKTGPLGMGHAVIHVRDPEPSVRFYSELLDFNVTDYGLTPYPLYFFHVNGRHHSFALVGSGGSGFHHFMVEYHNLDDVGQGYDLALLEEGRIAYTLGRHTNDFMTGFYANTPSGFFVENGWGGRVIDPDTWEPHETYDGPSFWGHERLFLPEKVRNQFRDMRLDLAARGIKGPPISQCPWLFSEIAGA